MAIEQKKVKKENDNAFLDISFFYKLKKEIIETVNHSILNYINLKEKKMLDKAKSAEFKTRTECVKILCNHEISDEVKNKSLAHFSYIDNNTKLPFFDEFYKYIQENNEQYDINYESCNTEKDKLNFLKTALEKYYSVIDNNVGNNSVDINEYKKELLKDINYMLNNVNYKNMDLETFILISEYKDFKINYYEYFMKFISMKNSDLVEERDFYKIFVNNDKNAIFYSIVLHRLKDCIGNTNKLFTMLKKRNNLFLKYLFLENIISINDSVMQERLEDFIREDINVLINNFKNIPESKLFKIFGSMSLEEYKIFIDNYHNISKDDNQRTILFLKNLNTDKKELFYNILLEKYNDILSINKFIDFENDFLILSDVLKKYDYKILIRHFIKDRNNILLLNQENLNNIKNKESIFLEKANNGDKESEDILKSFTASLSKNINIIDGHSVKGNYVKELDFLVGLSYKEYLKSPDLNIYNIEVKKLIDDVYDNTVEVNMYKKNIILNVKIKTFIDIFLNNSSFSNQNMFDDYMINFNNKQINDDELFKFYYYLKNSYLSGEKIQNIDKKDVKFKIKVLKDFIIKFGTYNYDFFKEIILLQTNRSYFNHTNQIFKDINIKIETDLLKQEIIHKKSQNNKKL